MSIKKNFDSRMSIKKNFEIFSLVLLILFTAISTSYLNSTKKENLEMKTKNCEKLKKNIHFITYGDEKYKRSKNRLLNEAKIFFDFNTYIASKLGI